MKMRSEKSSNKDGNMLLDLNALSGADTKRLNGIADEIKAGYTAWIDSCCKKHADSPLLYALPMVCRNTFLDDTFLSVCRMVLACEHLKRGDVYKVITVNESERQVIAALASPVVTVSSAETEAHFAKSKNTVRRFLSTFRFIRQELAYMRLTGRNVQTFEQPVSMIFTPTISSGFRGYEYNDRYFTGITEYKNDLVFLPTLNNNAGLSSRELIDRMKNCSNYRFLLPFPFLRISDFGDIFRMWKLSDAMKKDPYVFAGIDLAPVMCRALERGKSNIAAQKAVLMRKIVQRMRKKVPLANAVVWYEGRPNDIMTVAAIRENYQNVCSVGYQGYPFPESNIGLCISEYQYTSGHAPDRLAISSKLYEGLAHQFCETIPLLYAPIMRSDYCVQKPKLLTKPYKRILLLLSYFVETSSVILRGIDHFIRTNPDEYEIMIKNHPTKDGYTVEDYGMGEPAFTPRYLSGRLTDCFEGVDVVVTSLTGSTLEVVFAGIPLIVLSPQGELVFTALPKETEKKFCHIAYDADELSVMLKKCMLEKPADPAVLTGMMVQKSKEAVAQLF
ncbi:MAG: hypothetical protein IJU25_00475 [Lachnospiraceae bacterium]|nr:hypothetical protein [Lachnospiraceae bacterium]